MIATLLLLLYRQVFGLTRHVIYRSAGYQWHPALDATHTVR